MYPDSPPLLALPATLSAETAAQLHALLLELAHALEYHYGAQIRRDAPAPEHRQAELWDDEELPF